MPLVVGRIFKVHAAPVGTPWMWTLAFGQHEDRTPTHGYEPTREARAPGGACGSLRADGWLEIDDASCATTAL